MKLAEKRIGLKTIFRSDIEDYENWKNEWALVTNQIRLIAAKSGIDLSKIEIVREDEI